MCNCKKQARQFCWHLKRFGHCRYGRNCRYRHGKVNHECPYFKANQCVFGVRCWLKHSLPKPATIADFVEAEVKNLKAKKGKVKKERCIQEEIESSKVTAGKLLEPSRKHINKVLEHNAKLRETNHRLGDQIVALNKELDQIKKTFSINKIKELEATVKLLGEEVEKKNDLLDAKNDLIVSLAEEKKSFVSEQNTIQYLKNHIQELEKKLGPQDEPIVIKLQSVEEIEAQQNTIRNLKYHIQTQQNMTQSLKEEISWLKLKYDKCVEDLIRKRLEIKKLKEELACKSTLMLKTRHVTFPSNK